MSEVINTAPDFDAMSDEELVCWVRSNGTDTVSNWSAKIDKRYSGAIRREGDRMRAAMLYNPEGHRNRYRVFDVSGDECGIRVLPGRRPLNEDTIAQLVASIDRCGLLNPPAVRMVDKMVVNGTEEYNVPVLVYGHHRIEAMRRLGWSWVTCLVLDLHGVDAELSEIAENLHRAELTALQRDEQIARWIELTTVKGELPDLKSKPVQPAQVSGGRGNKGGLSDAARELGIERTDAHRAIKVADLSPEAKAAAVETGLDDNRSALLEAAKEKEPEKQVVSLQNWRQRKGAEVRLAARPAIIAATQGDEKLKKQLAKAKQESEEKEEQRQAQEHRANIAVRQVDSATNRAMYAEADKQRLQAEVDRLTDENKRLEDRYRKLWALVPEDVRDAFLAQVSREAA